MKETISLNFKILVTARLNSKPEWLLEFFQDNEYYIINIEFKPEENIEFIKNLNINESLTLNSKRYKPIFSNLFILNIFSNIENPENIYTEWDVVRLWWNKYIESSEKRQVLLNFSKKIIESPEKWKQIDNINIANDLIKNYILIKNEYESFYTAHDIYRDDVLNNNIEKLKQGRPIQEWIQIDNGYFQISMVPIACPWTGKYDCHVNNAGMVKQNPLDELQICIDKKIIKPTCIVNVVTNAIY